MWSGFSPAEHWQAWLGRRCICCTRVVVVVVALVEIGAILGVADVTVGGGGRSLVFGMEVERWPSESPCSGERAGRRHHYLHETSLGGTCL